MAFIIDDIAVVSAAAEATIESESPNAVESTIAKDATAAIDDIAKQSSSVDAQKVEGDSPSSEESLDNAHFVDDFPAQVANDVLSEIGSITEDNVFYDEFPSETESLSNSDPESSTQTIPINNVIENELPTNSNSPLDRMQNRDVNAEDISTETKTSLENDANLDTPLYQKETN